MKQFFVALVSFMVLDGLWLGVVMSRFYRDGLSTIARLGPDGSMAPLWAAALPVYVLLALGQVWFVVPRVTTASSAAMWGAALGLVIYGVYDLTNWSVLRGYPPSVVFVDLAWGTFACATVAVILRKF